MSDNKKIYVGIDLALKNSSLCFIKDDIYYILLFTDNKKIKNIEYKNIRIKVVYYFDIDLHIKEIKSFLSEHAITDIILEGYSFSSSSSSLYQLHEYGGVLKHAIFRNYNLHIIPPSQIKKNATSYGNAKKDMMFNCLEEEIKSTLKELSIMFNSSVDKKGIGDIVDSIHIYNMNSELGDKK